MERPWNRTVIRSKPRWALLVREQIVAAATLARAALAATGPATQPRFVVQSLGRSGSTLLTDLLAAHPAIECDGEILSHPLLITTPDRLVRDRARLFPAKCYGFKIRPRHYHDQQIDPTAFLRGLCDDGWHVIHLERRNLLRIALSWVANAQTKVVHRTVRDRSGIRRQHVPIPMLMQQLARVAGDVEVERKALAGVPHHRLVYEDDLLTPDVRQASMDRLFGTLGLQPAPVSTKLVRLTSDRLEDFVENSDEVRAALQGTEWEKYL